MNEQSQFAGLGHGRDAHATGDGSAADAANVRNEPNLDGPKAEREGRVVRGMGGRGTRELYKQSQFGDGRKSGPLQLRCRSQCL